MAYTNSRGGKPARRSTGTDRSSGGEGKKIFNRNDKGRSSDSRDRKPYGDSPRGSYSERPRSERPYNADRPFNKERSERPYNADRPYNKERSNSDRPYNTRHTERSNRSEGGENEFRPYRPATDRRASNEDKPWVARAQRSEFGSVPRGGKGERNRSFKAEKDEYRSRQSENKPAPRQASRPEEGGTPRIGSKKSIYGAKPNPNEFTERKPYAKKSYGSDERKSFGGSDRGYSKDRSFNSEERNEGGRFSKEKRAYRANQGPREGFAPRENRFNKETDGEFRPYRPAGEKRFFREDRPNRDERPSREGRPAREERTGRPDRVADRRKRSFNDEPVGEAPNYAGLKRYSNRDKNRSEDLSADGQLRLNRYIANAGICSRREADELIAAGEIRVNGEVVTELGYKVKPTDTVQYGKKNLSREKLVYVLLNKPKDFITTTEDPEGRKTVMDLVANASKERIFPVGRLDRNTTGLLLFTNDGELAQKLTHPSHKNSKIYQVELDKPLTKEHFEQIQNGLELEDGKATVDDLALIGNTNKFIGIEIHIGRNRIVRRIFESLGYEVVTLDRVQYAGLTKKDLPRGNWRFLTEKEVIRLKYFL